MTMMYTVTLCLALVAVVYGDANCNSNRKGDAWCARRINEMKTMSGYNAAQPAAPFTGQKCTTAAADNGLFRDTFCCKACKEFLGGGTQAIKDNSYMGTAVGKVCADNTAFAAYCTNFSPSHPLCQVTGTQNVATKFCEYTCGLCSTTNQQMIHSTQAACTSLSTCNNQTMCKQSTTIGSGQCTTDGQVPGDGTVAPFLDGGTCNCAECTGYLGKSCTGDDTCGGFDHHCQAMDGKCNCGKCELNKVCFTDDDCGGTIGTCGYISTGGAVGLPANKYKLYTCPAEKFGKDGELCRCNWCPGPKACRNHGTACTPTDAAVTCGDVAFCVGEAGAQKCGCKPPKEYKLVAEWKMPAVTAVAADGVAPICISGILCGTDGDGPGQCGIGNEGACKALDGTSVCTGALADMTCKCNCAAITAPPSPNYCMGFQTAADGTTALKCALGGTTECGMAAAPVAGDTKKDVCAPDMSTGMCLCGLPIYPKWSSYSGKKCTSITDCQSTTDTSAVCVKVDATTGLGTAECNAAAVTAGECACQPATLANVDFAITTTKCTTDAHCGWGKCVDQYSLMKCPVGDTACICVSAGCVDGQACGLSASAETCGGPTTACQGKCFCG